LGDPE